MAIEHDRVLAEISRNYLTMLVITIEGAILQTEALDSLPSSERIVEATRANAGNAVRFVPRQAMSEEQLQKIIASSIDALKLDQAGKLKPGANLFK